MYQSQEQMREDQSTTRTIENEKFRTDGASAQQRYEDKQETKRIAKEKKKKKPKPRKPSKKQRR